MRSISLLAALLTTPALAQPTLLSLGPCGTYQYQGDGARAVSADGLTIGASLLIGDTNPPCLWAPADGVVVLNDDWYGRVAAISADGSTAVGSHGNGGESFLWQRGQPLTPLLPFPPGYFLPIALSGDGTTVVGDYYLQDASMNILWTQQGGVVQIPPFPGATNMQLRGLSYDGSIAVGFATDAVSVWAARWTASGGTQSLGAPAGAATSQAQAVSDDGNSAAGYAAYPGGMPTIAFRWTASGGMQSLGLPAGATGSYAFAISRDGSVVAGNISTPAGPHAFMWRVDLGSVDLNTYLPALGADLTNWTIVQIRALSRDGRVLVGRALHQVSPELIVPEAIAIYMDGPCNSPDFNHDGIPGDQADIEAFFACLAGSCCPTCDTTDFNRDGDSATDTDIEAFLRVLAGGAC